MSNHEDFNSKLQKLIEQLTKQMRESEALSEAADLLVRSMEAHYFGTQPSSKEDLNHNLRCLEKKLAAMEDAKLKNLGITREEVARAAADIEQMMKDTNEL